jgi:hypothetical protein
VLIIDKRINMDVYLSCSNRKHEDILKKAARFYVSELLGPKLASKIKLDIELDLEMSDKGNCCPDTDGKYPKEFTIQLKKDKQKEMLQALAHESVHLAQYAKGRLGHKFDCSKVTADSNPNQIDIDLIWEGKFWKPKGNEDPYWSAPWEREAYGLEYDLYLRFIRSQRRLKKVKGPKNG